MQHYVLKFRPATVWVRSGSQRVGPEQSRFVSVLTEISFGSVWLVRFGSVSLRSSVRFGSFRSVLVPIPVQLPFLTVDGSVHEPS